MTHSLCSRAARALACALSAALLLAGTARAADAATTPSFLNESPSQHDARMQWFREARFGMFIHWGLYSQAAGSWDGKPSDGAGEWIMNDMKIPDSQYAKLVGQFNPVKFDAKQWVALAKGAGMKYIVITSKHHEGFGMYPSALTDWCIKSTPFGRDPLKELAAACQDAGIKLCFYHSIMDWHHPDYLPRKSWNDLANPNPDFDKYVAHLKGQLKELLTGYGPIGLVWFDGQWEDSWTYPRGLDLYNYVRSLQPNIIVNNRVGPAIPPGMAKLGDYGTPEQYIPAAGLGAGVDWETCMTMNNTWGFKEQDHDWKSTATLIHNLVDIASKGGNYLLNVGPTGEGLIPDASATRLQEIGQWMQVNGEGIYGTTASPFHRQLPWGRCTTKTSSDSDAVTLYFHVFKWPADGSLVVPGLKTKPRKIFLLTADGKKNVKAKLTDDGLALALPATAPSEISSTIVAQFSKSPDIEMSYSLQSADGSVTLPAREAQVHGGTVQYEGGGNRDNIGFWTDPHDWVDWQFKARTAGKFKVVAQVAALGETSFEVSLGSKTLRVHAPVTSGYTDFKTVDIGTLEIATPGVVTVAVHPVTEGWSPLNLKSLKLTPVAP